MVPDELHIRNLVPGVVPDQNGEQQQAVPAPAANQPEPVPDVNELVNRIKAIEEKQRPTVESVKKAIIQYALRQKVDFDKYMALHMAEQLKTVATQVNDKKADFYSSVHFTLTEKITKPPEQFKSYILSLLGDRDYEKIIEAINKVDKSFGEGTTPLRTHSFVNPAVGYHVYGQTSAPQRFPPNYGTRQSNSPPLSQVAPYYRSPLPFTNRNQRNLRPIRSRHCFYCGRYGHMAHSCLQRNGLNLNGKKND